MALPDNTSGGWLHIVLDDGNIGDDSVDFCIGEAEKNCDEEAEELARLLRIMSHTQRKRIYMGR